MTDIGTVASTSGPTSPDDDAHQGQVAVPVPSGKPEEFGGRDGPDPTRYGDWEKSGRCIDF